MENAAFLNAVRSRGKIIVVASLFVSAASFLFVVFSQSAFVAKTDFLVIQNTVNAQDSYMLSRSSEYLGKVLSESIYSEKFIDAVIGSGKVPAASFSLNKNEKLNQWAERISVEKNLELGMINVKVFGDDQKEIMRTSQAVIQVLSEKNALFRGGDEKSVEVRVLSGPVMRNNPSIAKLVMVIVGGFFFGVFLNIFWIFARMEMSDEELIARDDVPQKIPEE